MRRYVVDAGVLFLHFIDDEIVKPYFDEVVQDRAQGFIKLSPENLINP